MTAFHGSRSSSRPDSSRSGPATKLRGAGPPGHRTLIVNDREMRKLLKNLPPERQLTADEALALADADDLDLLAQAAARRRDCGHGSLVS